jgi:metallo-beta-lactamase class B/metallo-beta-lactamase class B GIM
MLKALVFIGCLLNVMTGLVLAKELTITAVDDGVYLHKSYHQTQSFGLVSANGLVVVDGGQAYLVDTPWSEADTEKLAAWIHDQGWQLAGSLSTHSHDDRAGGMGWLNEQGIPTHALALTNQILKANGKAMATVPFNGPAFSWVPGTLEVFYPGGGHTVDNVTVWLPGQRLLFGGCLIRSMATMSLGFIGEARLDEWAGSVETLQFRYPDALMVVPGHGRLGNRSLLSHTHHLASQGRSQQQP